MKKTIAVVAGAIVGLAAAGACIASEELAKKNGCTGCHDVNAKKVGPSFKSIAAKYKGQADAEKKVVEELKSGKGHMAVKTSDADTTALVKWVLSL